MPSFTDSAGREWPVGVDVERVRRLREACGVDLPSLAAGDMAALSRLLMDPVALAAALYELCGARAAGLDFAAFAAGLSGEPLQAAAEALAEAVFAFLPLQVRPVLHRAARQGPRGAPARGGDFDTRPEGLAGLLDAAPGEVRAARRRVFGEHA